MSESAQPRSAASFAAQMAVAADMTLAEAREEAHSHVNSPRAAEGAASLATPGTPDAVAKAVRAQAQGRHTTLELQRVRVYLVCRIEYSPANAP